MVNARAVVQMLVRVARAAFHAAEDSEQVEGDDGLVHVVSSQDFDDLSDALDALEELPDDQPGWTMHGPAKAEWALRALLAAEAKRGEVPDITDTARAALLWVLWHHQGGSSPVGQPIRFALGMGQHEHLSDSQVADAKQWGELRGFGPGECREPAPVSTADAPLPDRLIGFIKPDTDTHVYFYEQDFYVLSNFSAFEITWKGLNFPTSEHAYHWEKFSHPVKGESVNDRLQRMNLADSILTARSAHEAFKTAGHWKNMRRADWDRVKVLIMHDILRAKAIQHEYVRRKLLATGDRTLIEDSWRDDFWGWGPNRDGQNMLGKLWMQVREELRSEVTP